MTKLNSQTISWQTINSYCIWSFKLIVAIRNVFALLNVNLNNKYTKSRIFSVRIIITFNMKLNWTFRLENVQKIKKKLFNSISLNLNINFQYRFTANQNTLKVIYKHITNIMKSTLKCCHL